MPLIYGLSWKHPAAMLVGVVVLTGLAEFYLESKFPSGQGGLRPGLIHLLMAIGGLVFAAWAPLYMIARPGDWLVKKSFYLGLDTNGQEKNWARMRLTGYAIFTIEIVFLLYRIIYLAQRL